MTPHSSQDDEGYRTDAERAEAVAADPLPRLRDELLSVGLLTMEADGALRATIASGVEQDQDRALERPEPDAERARRWLFAGDPVHVTSMPAFKWETLLAD